MLKSIFPCAKKHRGKYVCYRPSRCNRRYISDLLMQRYGLFLDCANIFANYFRV